jgi:hypothetical protein
VNDLSIWLKSSLVDPQFNNDDQVEDVYFAGDPVQMSSGMYKYQHSLIVQPLSLILVGVL